MTRTILAAIAVVVFGGLSAVATLAQERPFGHESAVGPRAEPRGPTAMEEGAGPRGLARPGGAAPMMAPGVRPGPASRPAQVPYRPAFGQQPLAQAPQRAMQPEQQPMQPTPRPPMRPNNGAVPSVGGQRAPNVAPQAAPGAPAAPINRAPQAHGPVPAPFHGGNMRHFVDQDARVWQGGSWHHHHHDGRDGWWWVVGGLWYFYPEPVYPYPDPFVPGDVVFGPASAGQYWYYCASAGQYYPYVTYCPEGWQAVVPYEQEDSDE